MPSSSLTSADSRQPASSGTPTGDTKTGGSAIYPLTLVESVIVDTAPGNRNVTILISNQTAGAILVTLYMKLVTYVAGVKTPATATQNNALMTAFSLGVAAATLPQVVAANLILPADYQLTGFASAVGCNVVVSGFQQR